MLFSGPFDENSPRMCRIISLSLSDDLRVVEIGYNRTPKGLRQNMKRDVYILHYIIGGRGEFCGNKFEENNGYIVVPNEYESIIADSEEPYEAYWIMFKGSKAIDFLKNCNLPCHNGVFEFGHTKECADILKDALFNTNLSNELEEASIMYSAFYQIMALHFASLPSTLSLDTVSRKVKRYIDENYFNNISVESISKSFNFSRNYLYTLFKNDYGTSMQGYLLDLRVEKAKELLLKERHLLISEVALAVGYSDSLYFSRVFRKKTGMSPSGFVKMNT